MAKLFSSQRKKEYMSGVSKRTAKFDKNKPDKKIIQKVLNYLKVCLAYEKSRRNISKKLIEYLDNQIEYWTKTLQSQKSIEEKDPPHILPPYEQVVVNFRPR